MLPWLPLWSNERSPVYKITTFFSTTAKLIYSMQLHVPLKHHTICTINTTRFIHLYLPQIMLIYLTTTG